MTNNITAEAFEQFIGPVLNQTGAIARKHFGHIDQVDTKADNSPVTKADKEIEALIRAHIERTYPSHSIMGEEGEDKQTRSPYSWIIDPIDGTKAFIAGKATFTTLIGLLYDGAPIYGVVDQPITGERWQMPLPREMGFSKSKAIGKKPGEGRLTRGAGPHPSPLPRGEGIAVATTSLNFMSDEQCARLEAWKRSSNITLHYGGDAYAYMMLLEGKLDAVFDIELKPYDILPLLPILAQDTTIHVQFLDKGRTSNSPTGNVIISRDNKLIEAISAILAT